MVRDKVELRADAGAYEAALTNFKVSPHAPHSEGAFDWTPPPTPHPLTWGQATWVYLATHLSIFVFLSLDVFDRMTPTAVSPSASMQGPSWVMLASDCRSTSSLLFVTLQE